MKKLLLLLVFLASPVRAGLILEASTDSLEVTTSTAAAIDYDCSWTDNTTTAFTPSKSAGQISSATTTTVVAAPSASTQRNVMNCTWRNTSTTTANVLTLQRDVSATNRTLYSATLAPGEALAFTGERYFRYAASGAEITTSPDAGYNGKAYQFSKAGSAKDSAGYAVANSPNAGVPGAWVPGTPGVNGAVLDCSTAAGATIAGAHYIVSPASGNLYLTQIAISGSVAAEQLEIVDALWYNTGLTVTTTTAQTFTTPTLPARDINGSTNGEGVNLALLTTTANTNAGAISNTTASYTDSEGNTGAAATFAAMVGWQAPVSPVITTWMPFQLAAGDRGIRALTAASSGGITLATSYGGGALSAVLYRSLITIPNQLANSAVLINLPSPGIRIYPGTCIWMILRGTATAASVSGSYTIMERP